MMEWYLRDKFPSPDFVAVSDGPSSPAENAAYFRAMNAKARQGRCRHSRNAVRSAFYGGTYHIKLTCRDCGAVRYE